jgi:diguanylate cyclase (GGDEF)-like protein
VSGDEARRDAYLTAYELFEAVQSEAHAEALARIPLARERARRQDWPEVDLVLAGAAVVHDVSRPPSGVPLPPSAVTALVEQAEAARLPALLAVALGLRGLAASATGDTRGLMSDTSRAIALLDDEHQPPLDRCTGLVVAAGVFNTLRLWELVDALYGRAADLGPSCDVPAMAAAIGVNRVLTRVEWAVALLENGDEEQCLLRLRQALDAVPDALAQALPPLWRRDVEALGMVAGLLSGTAVADVAAQLATVRTSLEEDGDIEVLPLLDGAVAWSLWHSGSSEAAVEVANRLALVCSASSGARSFPLWVRAQVLAAAQPSAAVRAQQDHAAMLSRLRWESRQAVLVAAQAQIAAARRQAEHEGLSRAVRTDPLTGLDNRRTFDAWLDRGDSAPLPPTALLLVDLDDFKAVNDNYGHDYGDEVLRRLGRLLLESVRPGDLAVRLGGDEFAVLLSGESLTTSAARTRARELHAAISSETWGEVSRGLVVSASIGLAVSDRSRGGPRTAALYRAADAALYAAKGTGGDAVVVADDLDTGGLAGVGLTRPARRSALG